MSLWAFGCASGAQGPAPVTERPASSAGSEPVAAEGTRGLRVVSAPEGTAATETPAQGGRVRVRIEASRRGQPVEFRPGETTLRSGDRIVMYVRSDRDGWLNVVQFFPDGTSAVLSSSDGTAVQTRAGEETRIPAGTDQIELDDVTGAENVYVVASARPLAEVDQTVSRLVDEVRTSGAAAAQGARPTGSPRTTPHATPHAAPRATTQPAPAASASPDLLAGLSRGMRVVPSAGGSAAESDVDARGVAVLRVSFQHAH